MTKWISKFEAKITTHSPSFFESHVYLKLRIEIRRNWFFRLNFLLKKCYRFNSIKEQGAKGKLFFDALWLIKSTFQRKSPN